MSVIWEAPKPKVATGYRVVFDSVTGNIISVTNDPNIPDDNPSIETTYEDVEDILTGEESITDIKVTYNTQSKLYELDRNVLDSNVHDINDWLYECNDDVNADIRIIQDLKNTCWKFYIGKELQAKLNEQKVTLNVDCHFHITEKNNPNVLHKTLSFSLNQLRNEFYIVLPFSEDYEFDGMPLSVYTIRRFDTYSYEVTNE